jgi:dipeptidyl aminopeptidase/acylaminoacyl peptidase
VRPRNASTLIAAVLALASGSAAARPMVLEDVVTFRTITDLRVSPDRAAAVAAVRHAELERNRFETHLFLIDLAGGAPARQLTFTRGADTHPRFSPDGKRIAFLSDRGGTMQVWGLPRQGGEAIPLTSHAKPIADFDWAPDGRRLLVIAGDPASPEEEKRKKEQDDGYLLGTEWKNDRIWIADVAGDTPATGLAPKGGLVPLTDGRRHVAEGAVWSPDGRRIAFVSTPTAEEDSSEEALLQVVTVSTGEIGDVRGGDRATAAAWSPDGRWLAFIRPFDGKGISRADLFLWPAVAQVRKSGDDVARDATAALDREAEALAWSPDGAAVDVFYSDGTVHAMARVEIAALGRTIEIGGRQAAGKPQVLWRPGHTVDLPQRAGAGWVYVRGDHPAEVWRAIPPKAGRPLTVLNAAATALDLPVVEAVRWQGPKWPIEGVLVRPRQVDASRRYPLILRPHGGPRSNTMLEFDPQAAYFASLGFLVLKPNFRGSTGYGDAFVKGNVSDWGDGPLQDVLGGADDLIARGMADGSRLFWYGWSYSGYLANWAITHTPRLRAAVSGAGVADLRMQYILSDARRWRFDYFTGSPFTGNEATYAKESPITYVRDARVPTLFITGEKDERCPPPQSLMMHRALLDAGVESALLIYPREGHDFSEPRHILDRLRRAADWFRGHDRAPGG